MQYAPYLKKRAIAKIESTISYRPDIHFSYRLETIRKNSFAENSFLKIRLNETICTDENHYFLEITVKKQMITDILYSALIKFNEKESIARHEDAFPFFNHKSGSQSIKIVETLNHLYLIKPKKPFPFSIEKIDSNKLKLDIIIDAPFLHPAWDLSNQQKISSSAPILPVETIYKCSFSISRFDLNPRPLFLQQFIYPYAKKSAFILTDHCYFDSAEKLKLFLHGNNNNGWLGRGLRITKGVFTLGSIPGEPKKNDSIEDEPYASLINELYKDGSEIAPHALKSRGQLNNESFHQALRTISGKFHPKTWIDHGNYLKYCYSQGAKENPEYRLVDSLKQYGFNNLWSYHDVNIDALNTLNIFSSRKYTNRPIWLKISKYIFKGKWLISAHYFRSIFHRNYSKSLLSDFLIYAMANTKGVFIGHKNKDSKVFNETRQFFSRLSSFKRYRSNSPVPYKNSDLRKYSTHLFTEDRRPFSQASGSDLLMFCTFEATHLLDIYTQKALDNLIAEYGTHIGHTYILNTLPYLNHIFSYSAEGKLQLSEKWIDFLNTLSTYVKEGLVWNPPMGEYVDYVQSLQNVRIDYKTNNTVYISNLNINTIHGYTFIIPADTDSGIKINDLPVSPYQSDQHYHFFVLDLQPYESIKVSK